MRLPRPGAEVRADQLQVASRRRTRRRTTGCDGPDQQEHRPGTRTRTRRARRCGRPAAAPYAAQAAERGQHRRDAQARRVPLHQRRVPDRERGQVDQAVAGRHVRRHVVEAVDVDLEQSGEKVYSTTVAKTTTTAVCARTSAAHADQERRPARSQVREPEQSLARPAAAVGGRASSTTVIQPMIASAGPSDGSGVAIADRASPCSITPSSRGHPRR